MLNPEIYGDVRRTRSIMRLIALSLLAAAGGFAIVVQVMIRDAEPEGVPNPADFLQDKWLGASIVLVLASTYIGSRIHDVRGSTAAKTQQVSKRLLLTFALSDVAALIGLVHVLTVKSWEVKLAPIIGGVSLLLCLMRAEFAYGRIIRDETGPASEF